jgi:hypothetical protein
MLVPVMPVRLANISFTGCAHPVEAPSHDKAAMPATTAKEMDERPAVRSLGNNFRIEK